jgi:hypothetical protein
MDRANPLLDSCRSGGNVLAIKWKELQKLLEMLAEKRGESDSGSPKERGKVLGWQEMGLREEEKVMTLKKLMRMDPLLRQDFVERNEEWKESLPKSPAVVGI